MAGIVKITSPTANSTYSTGASSVVISGTSQMIVFANPQADMPTRIIPLINMVNADDGMTSGLVAALDPTRWTVRYAAGIAIYRGSSIQYLATDELIVNMTLVGVDPGGDPGENLYSYDGDPPEQFTPLGASLASFTEVDNDGDGRTEDLTFAGSIVNSAGTTPFAVNEASPQHLWTSGAVALQPGINTITITATDDLANNFTDVITITRTGSPKNLTLLEVA